MAPQSRRRRISVFLLAFLWTSSGTGNAAGATTCVYHGESHASPQAGEHTPDSTDDRSQDRHDHSESGPEAESAEDEATEAAAPDGGHGHAESHDCRFLCLAMAGIGGPEIPPTQVYGVAVPKVTVEAPAGEEPSLPRITLPFFLPLPNPPPS